MVYYASGKWQSAGRRNHRLALHQRTQRHEDGPGRSACHRHGVGHGGSAGSRRQRQVQRGRMQPGTVTQKDILGEYTDHLMQFVEVDKIKPFKILADRRQRRRRPARARPFRPDAAAERDGNVLRAGRHFPEPSLQPVRAGEHRGADPSRSRRRRGLRRGVGRRRRPRLLPGRDGRARARRLRDHAGRAPLSQTRSRRGHRLRSARLAGRATTG